MAEKSKAPARRKPTREETPQVEKAPPRKTRLQEVNEALDKLYADSGPVTKPKADKLVELKAEKARLEKK